MCHFGFQGQEAVSYPRAVGPPPDPVEVDRYGFIITTDNPGYSLPRRPTINIKERNRLKKWRRMVGAGGVDWSMYLQRHKNKVKKRIRKGIPDALRGLVWQLLSGEISSSLRGSPRALHPACFALPVHRSDKHLYGLSCKHVFFECMCQVVGACYCSMREYIISLCCMSLVWSR